MLRQAPNYEQPLVFSMKLEWLDTFITRGLRREGSILAFFFYCTVYRRTYLEPQWIFSAYYYPISSDNIKEAMHCHIKVRSYSFAEKLETSLNP